MTNDDLKRFYQTNAQPDNKEDFVRYDKAGRAKVADGVNPEDAVNFKQLIQYAGGPGSDLNYKGEWVPHDEIHEYDVVYVDKDTRIFYMAIKAVQDSTISPDKDTEHFKEYLETPLGGIKTFTGTNIELYNKIASREFKAGDFVWLDNVTKDPSITNITDTKLVNGKVLMQIVDGPFNYEKSQFILTVNFKEYYTVILYNVAFKDTVSSYGTTNNHLKTAVGTERFSIYETHFAMRANPNAASKGAYDFYWFVSASLGVGSAPRNVQLNATTSITENNDQAVTSGAVYKALEKKQATLTSEQLNAVNSGITSEKVTQIATNTSDIATLQTQIGNIDTLLTQIDSGSGV